MQVSGINNVISKLDTQGSTKTKPEGSSFTDILTDAMNAAQETQKSVEVENEALLTGETDSLHTPIIEAQKAELALNLAIQVRNKVISAYNEVMGMQL